MIRNMNVIREHLRKLLFFIILTLGTTAVWGQDYSGVYYIANKIWNGSNTSSPYYYYSSSTPEYNWYLVPAKDPQLTHKSDAYFNAQYVNTDSKAVDYTGDNYGDPEKPFLTTYRTNRDNNSIWILKKTGNYYYIIHGLTGKYVKYEPPYKSFPLRKTMHLEAVDSESPDNAFQFSITTNTSNGITGLNIAPRNKTGNYFNPAGDNWERYYGTNGGNKTPYSQGLVGLYSSDLDKGGSWPKENAAFAAPTINDNAYPTITVTDSNELPSGYHFRYTFGDGTQSDPTAESAILEGGSFTVTSSGTLKVVIERYGIILTRVASKELGPAKPTFNVSNDGSVSISATGGTIYYTLDGNTPTTSSTPYNSSISASDIASAEGMAIKAIVVDDQGITSLVAEIPLNSYNYKIVNKSNGVAVQTTVKQPVGMPLDGGYNDIPEAIRSPYISDETITFYSMEGEFDANNLDVEHRINATPAGSANIYVTYSTDKLGEKSLHLQGARPFNLKNSSSQYYVNSSGTTLTYDNTNTETTPNVQNKNKDHIWYISGRDPYAVTITCSETNNYLTSSSVSSTLNTFILKSEAGTTVTFQDASGSIAVTINEVTIPTSYYLIDKTGKILLGPAASTSSSITIPSEWYSPLAVYHYWKSSSFDEANGVYTLKDAQTELSGLENLGTGEHIYITYDVKDDIDLDGRNLLNDQNKKEGTTYMLQFQTPNTEDYKFYQEDGKDGVMTEKRRAVYPYSNGDATLYVYGNERWEEQLASGASTRTRWLWYLEPATTELDPYHVRVSSYQTQTSYKIDDNNTRNFHSYLRTYKPDGYNAVVTGVTNNNPLAHGGQKADDAVTNLPAGSEYMLLGTSLENLKLVTVDAISDGTTTERRTVNSFEQYWKNNPTVQGKLTTKVETPGRNVTLSETQKTELAAIDNEIPWHTYKAWANSQPWVNNGDGSAGKAPTTSKKFDEQEHVFQTIMMGESFQLVPTEIKPMLILLDQHGWEIVRLPLPSGPDDPKRAERYAELHKYSSPMVARYHFWKTGSKDPGYHKFKVSNYATVSATDDTEYTADELGRADLAHSTPNLPDYASQAFDTGGKERDWYVTYDVKPEYASTYAGAATEGATSAAPYLIKQGGRYAQINGTSLSSTDNEPSIESVPESMQWYLRPNFNIDEEMGYIYAGNPGAEEGAESKGETEAAYYAAGKNGFDPYNVQIQSVANTNRYFTTNTTGSAVSSAWTGTSSSISLLNMDTKQNVVGLDQVNMKITNATFMVVDDGNGNMRLMPRFDNTKVMQSFTILAAQAAAAAANDEGTGSQSLYLTMVPKVVHNSSEISAMGGYYMLASNFTASGSIGTKTVPFKGTIEGQIGYSFSVSDPFIAYAEDAIIKNVIIESSSVSSSNADGHAGAIVATASGNTRIYNCGVNGGTISGTNHVGGIVGHMEDNARVINCYSYANVEGGSDKGGIVGYNNVATTAAMIGEGNGTMVMNCMFYGDISAGGNVAPIYGGEIINNLPGGLNTYNYYAYEKLTTGTINKYNCALAMEERYLNRFEFYRQLLNSNRRLAAYYASTSTAPVTDKDMMKWVLETADRSIAEPKQYPVLKAQGKYPSIINYDTRDLANYSEENRNQGLKTGTLTVNISIGSGYPAGAEIKDGKNSLTLVRTDKDFEHFNFNYDKVQLPYYNDVGTKNYTGNKVVTGWKITGFTGGTAGTYKAADEWGGYNFADRNCTNKDNYDVSGRVFAQGAYFDVPYGVTGITIEPYWANAVYVADEYQDVVYNTSYTAQSVSQLGKTFPTGKITIDGSEQTVYTSIATAISNLSGEGNTVYDKAVVLVGNLHQGGVPSGGDTPFTMLSVDLDKDNEPDYSMIFNDNNRTTVCPIRFDFLNIPGTAQAQKPNTATLLRNAAVFNPKGWFEITNTCLFYFSQFEYENIGKTAGKSPIILLGGVFDQFTSTKTSKVQNTTYLHVGSNAWFKEFNNGTHSDGNKSTKHIPISVTGGEYSGFYLTGTYNADAAVINDNAECYISGGHFEELAGAGQEQIGGNVQWQIYDADIDNFFGGGINENKPILGTITTDIINSHVSIFCGGPKFGNMQTDKHVTTNATGCTFDKYFGAGYGGNSVSKKKYYDKDGTQNWNTLQGYYTTDKGNYFDGESTRADWDGKHPDYGYKGKGVATDFDYDFFVWTSGATGARLFVKFTTFSLAQCNDVSSTLTGCTINNSFYGGGSLGNVTGTATSILDGCTVNGNVFGGGYSATLPKIKVRDGGFTKNPNFNSESGMFEPGAFSGTTDYEWTHVDNYPDNGTDGILDGNKVVTTVDLTALGQVGATVLTIRGGTKVSGIVEGETTGGVFGGGDMSAIKGNTRVNVEATDGEGVVNVYGGGNTADVDGNTEVNMTGGTVTENVYGGGKGQTTTVGGSATVNIGAKSGEGTLSGSGTVTDNVYGGSALGTVNTAAVNIYGGTVNGSVFGGGLGHDDEDNTKDIAAQNLGDATVTVEGGTVKTAVYGGSNENGVLKGNAIVTITGGTVGTPPQGNNPITNVVFGGGKGQPTLVNGDVTVNIGTKTGEVYAGTATINGNVYGGSALGCTNASKDGENPMVFYTSGEDKKTTTVNLYAGTINGNVFGGGLGQKAIAEPATPGIEAFVGGDVTVTLDGAKLSYTYTGEKTNDSDNRTFLTGQIFGANNLNGTPKGHVKVHVKRTNNYSGNNDYKNNSSTALAARTTYDLAAVYGGGNQADYVPTDALITLPATNADNYASQLAKFNAAFAEVLIEGCAATSIEYVYGGGNAAAVPASEVTINSAYIIDQVFGGGNGKSTTSFTNPGADVGKYNNGASDYGTGVAKTKLVGGQIHVAFGGSNTKGNVRGGTKMERKEPNTCSLKLGEIYGAGQEAPMDGDVNIVLECMPDDYVPQVFGGAKNATINGNVSLTVTSGKFGRVFGGNNEGGSINGSITVNVYEDGCQPLIIGELYGGGYNAPYSIYGCTQSGDTWTANTTGDTYFKGNTEIENNPNRVDVEVNVFSCTSIGKVFGGGYGSTADVIGNTHVWINTMRGIVNETPQTYSTGPDVYIGKIGQVFGGGNAAPVVGDVTIDIGTATANEGEKIGVRIIGGNDYLNAESNTTTSITAGIYGGGLSADVEGDVTMNIGTVSQNQGINIAGNIFGGGLGETTHVTGNIKVNIGKRTNTAQEGNPVYAYEGYANITGDVYGGSAKGKVNSSLVNSVETATAGKSTQVNLYGGTITGNLYGGGLGEATHAADVYGGVTVNVKGGSANNVFGCNNVNGTPKSTVAVNIDGGRIYKSVYGGGNQAIMDGSPVVNVTAGTIGTDNEGNTVFGGAVYGNVYGGGLGSDGTGEQPDLDKVKAGLVKGNTAVNISGGTILHNIYGGGAYGSVGTFSYDNTTSMPTGLATANTGKATINITGGTIGTNGHNNGMVFGSSRGDIDAPDAIHDKLAWVYETEVNIGTSGEGHGTEAPEPQIKGSVYGSGENGHTFNNAAVNIHSGKVGITDTSIDGGAAYAYRGNVYGGGCGTDKYYSNPAGVANPHDGNGNTYNPIAGIVKGNVTVTIDGGHVVRDVYGAGSMGSVIGKTTVNISGKSVIGADGSGGGYVFAAARGDAALTDANQAHVGSTELNISGGTIWQSAFGGGQNGIVKGSVDVKVSGGVVKNDVYGGGALANTNTDNWTSASGTNKTIYILVQPSELSVGTTPVYGLYTKNGNSYTQVTDENAKAEANTEYYDGRVLPGGNWAQGKTSASNTTTVTLTGGVIGNVYGGGLGDESTPVYVFGDVGVYVNRTSDIQTNGGSGVAFTHRTEDVTISGKSYHGVPITGNVFGCNNIKGTPLGNVIVEVYSTRQINQNNQIITGHGPNDTNGYDIQAVYGGGNQADYVPAADKKTQVTIYGCEESSISNVYGGGSSASVPATDVTIWGGYDIGYAFGGGNGSLPVKKSTGWQVNDGAGVIGLAKITCHGGKIGEIFGGSDAKGDCRKTSITQQQEGDCPLHITKLFGAGKETNVNGDVNVVISACTGGNSEIDYVCGGSYKARVSGDVHLTITSGYFKNVYGGNDQRGGIGGNIIVDIEETDPCTKPIIIQNLVGGGNQADYPGTRTDETPYPDANPKRKITVNVKSATRIDNIFGGCYKAVADANTEVNINMVRGNKSGQQGVPLPSYYNSDNKPSNIKNITSGYVNVEGLKIDESNVVGYYLREGESEPYTYTRITANLVSNGTVSGTAQAGVTYYEYSVIGDIDASIGTIGNVYGGGNQGQVNGNATVNIGTAPTVGIMKRNNNGNLIDDSNNPIDVDHITTYYYDNQKVLGAHILGDVFGGGYDADVTGNTTVNYCTQNYNNVNYSGTTGFERFSVGGSIYGGGNKADVLQNTNVTMSGGYVYNGIFGGGLEGSVGTYPENKRDKTFADYGHTPNHDGCIGKPTECTEGTGKCTVVVNGDAQIGPVEVATVGMDPTNTHGGPVPHGWVWGGGCGVIEDPATNPDTHFKAYVGSTDVTIGGTAFIMEGVIGGGEFGRVLGNTLVKIQENCQIGVGEGKAADGKPVKYTPEQWTAAENAVTSGTGIDAAAAAMPACSHNVFGRVVGGKKVYDIYDPYAKDFPTLYPGGSTNAASNGGTWIGVVFGGGSGYMPYKKDDGTGYDWNPSAGLVEGNATVNITGGHVLTNVYGGNEYTDVKGTSTVTMSGGTIGVPRTKAQIEANPLTGYLFGAGKGDPRDHFNSYTNVGSTVVNVSGGIIYGSVVGGSEDGHVLGNTSVTISGGTIGTWGTTYYDGNVFGGGRGFSGENLIAGSVGGNASLSISGGKILGSVYGGGRLASVGIDSSTPTNNNAYGQLVDDDENADGTIEASELNHGHVTVTITGGIIGTETTDGHTHSGNVYGGSMGRIKKLDDTTINDLWPKLAVVKTSSVSISSAADIKNNVYGGGEIGIVRNEATVSVSGGTVYGSVFGGGYGSDDHTTKTTITPAGYSGRYYTFIPMLWAGCVSGNTNVTVSSNGTVKKNVYGGGELASVGLINFASDASGNFTGMTKHESHSDDSKETYYDFGLSWPYEFHYIAANTEAPNEIGGKATVNISGGTIGTKDNSGDYADNTGYVFGGSKGKVWFGANKNTEQDITTQRYTEAFCANVRETAVTIGGGTIRTVYGGGDDGHVYENAKVTINSGSTIDRSVFGGGKGTSTFKAKLWDTSTKEQKTDAEDVHSWTAGKVYGNTEVIMNGGTVNWFIYGGGNLASVGKGNYSGGHDDYSTGGYGELPSADGDIWTATPAAGTYAHYFQNSGNTTVTILGGTLGATAAGLENGIPKGSVFGGSRGTAAKTITQSPRYKYGPDFFLGYVNKATINIGGTSSSALSSNTPNIYGCVYGGGQDGHVRNSTEVNIFKGNIKKQTGVAADRSGNVFGAGSGIGTYTDGNNQYCNNASGSVTCTTQVEVYDNALIEGNVYGGGAMASVGPPKIGQSKNEQKEASSDHTSYSHNVVNIKGGSISGSVYGASRGPGDAMFSGENPTFASVGTAADQYNPATYATSMWTEVNVTGGTIANNVYGGGEMGQVKESTVVNLTGGVIAHDVYGGGKGTTGTNAIEANVGGNTTVELNNNNNGADADGTKKGCIVDKVFGCNDLNGTPKGHVTVHVYATQNSGTGNMSTKVAPPAYTANRGTKGYKEYLSNLITEAKQPGGLSANATEITTAETLLNTTLANVEEASLTDAQKTSITTAATNIIAALKNIFRYDVAAVYGGGDLAPYDPTSTTENTEVIIEGCNTTSIQQVYGGGNAASVPATDVLVKSCAIIDELFGGGNGKDSYQYTDGKWYENPGANVGYRNYMQHVTNNAEKDGSTEALAYPAEEKSDATTPEARAAYKYGKGVANTLVNGGHIHTVYGGSNIKGNISNGIEMQLLQAGTCTLVTDEAYASSKSAETDAQSNLILDCVEEGGTIYGGSYNANLNSDVNILITNGHYDKVFGGNNQAGIINGKITITVQEAGCTPIRIGELYGGGYLAPYSIYGYKTETRLAKDKDGNDITGVYQRIPYMPGEAGALATPYWNPRINIISATHIGKIYGGGYGAGATMIGSPYINVNMEKGMILEKYAKEKEGYASLPADQKDAAGNQILSIGTIGDIYGGGELADVIGNTSVEIGTGRWISAWDENGNAIWETTNASGEKFTYKLETAAVNYTQTECNTYNATLTGALNSTDQLTEEQATAYNNAIKPETNKNTGDVLSAAEANAYNATLTGARNTNDIKTPAVWAWYDANNTESDAPTTTGRNAATITGNVFGGGKGATKDSGEGAFKCASAMVGADGDGLVDANGGTSVTISNGSVGGSVYGGGELGRVEKNTVVTIGIPGNTTNEVTIAGNVFGAGKGVVTHGYAALVRGNSTVTIQGKTKVGGNVYGGGEIASVGRYNVDANGLPQSLANEKSGNCTVIVRDDAEIGPDDMTMTKEGGPDNSGHVFGAGQGAMPYIGVDGNPWVGDPWRVQPNNSKDVFSTANYSNNKETKYLAYIETLGLATQTSVTISGNAFVKGDVFGGAEQGFVQHDTHVTIEGDCQIGNGYVQMADDGTYLANPLSVNRRYTSDEWSQRKLIMGDNDRQALKDLVSTTYYTSSLPECASWKYQSPYAAHDIYAGTANYDSKGGAVTAKSGRTFFGNVFGGGSGYFPYAAGKWHWKSGNVGGNTLVEIKGGHVLTNVYGGNEMTNVDGKATVTMTGGTIGVPRTLGQIAAHPVTCYLFGGGAGDPRVLFNKQTNVQDVEVSVTGGWVYGSVFGGGEDGRVMRNVDLTIGGTAKIGTWGTSYVDGNIFGGGRGFSADAYTAGNVAGSVTMNITGGEILGSVYGGGRLGSVGYGLYDEGEAGYGEIREDHKMDNGNADGGFFTKGRGHVDITISGGTIGNTNEFIIPQASNIPDGLPADFKTWSDANWTAWKSHNNVPNTEYVHSNGRVNHTKGGNVYAGGMGRREQLDGVTEITAVDWRKLGNVKSTKLTISGANTWIMGNVYGGGEVGAVQGYHNQLDDSGNPIKDSKNKNLVTGTEIVIKDGATIGTEVTETTPVKTTVAESGVVKYTFGSVYGGGMGTMKHYQSTTEHAGEVKDSTKVTISGAATSVRASVFGGGEIAEVDGSTNVTINNGKIGRDEVRPANDANPGYVMFGGATMGNVFGGGKGVLDHTNAGLVKGNTSVTVNDGYIYHNVYGGGALASVGTFTTSTGTGDDAHVPEGIPLHWTDGTGTANVTIHGGTIGISGRDNGMVNGSSRGDIEKPTGNPAADRYDKLAWVKDAVVTIGEATGNSAGPHIKGSVYGGGENGHNGGNATVTVNRGTIGVVDTADPWYTFIPEGMTENDNGYATYAAMDKKALITRGNVYGAGCGTDMYDSDGDGIDDTHNPKSGMVAGNTIVNINGGHIGHSVYGGGSMGPVGTITNNETMETTDKHTSEANSFALSWPYKFVFAEGTGKATVNITGGHIGTRDLDGGDVFGSTRGEAGDRYESAHYAYVGETEVNIDYTNPASESDVPNIKTDFSIPCITGAVHGSGEDGYVYGDTHVTLNKGLIGHSLYGGGKGKGTYKVTLKKVGGIESDTYETDIYSLIAGKVFGNTYVTMNGGIVGRNVYGGGNMASVGKGNYAGGDDDYSTGGYGETLTGNLWTSASEGDNAWQFLNSGKTTVNIFGGQVGIITTDVKNNMPYGNVFGGSAGEAAPNVPSSLTPRYHYCPAFFSGYVNETDVTIGGYRCKTAYSTYKVGDGITATQYNDLANSDKAYWELVGPTIAASVYGGGQDGHVRRDTKVTVYSGEIGLAYNSTNQGTLATTDLDNPQWMHRGNVYGGGSGISQYTSTLQYSDGYSGDQVPATGYSTSAGSVTRFAEVNILGGTIHRNVYGGGSMGSVGAPKLGQSYDPYKRNDNDTSTKGKQSQCTVTIGGGTSVARIGSPEDYQVHYGGEVYGASRGLSAESPLGSVVWTQIKVKNGATIQGNVYGGGDAGKVIKDTDVQIGAQ